MGKMFSFQVSSADWIIDFLSLVSMLQQYKGMTPFLWYKISLHLGDAHFN